jgi:hypothetical protein
MPGSGEVVPMRARPVIGLAIALLLSACSAGGIVTDPATPAHSAAPPVASTLPATSPEASAASELEGVWHTGVVTPDDAMAALQAADLQQAAQPFFEFWKIGRENVFTLRVSRGRWACYVSRDGGLSAEDDSGSYTIDGDLVTIRHSDAGTDTLRWSVDGDTLTISYVSDTFPADIPRGEEVYQRVLYMSSPWTRGLP